MTMFLHVTRGQQKAPMEMPCTVLSKGLPEDVLHSQFPEISFRAFSLVCNADLRSSLPSKAHEGRNHIYSSLLSPNPGTGCRIEIATLLLNVEPKMKRK